MKRVVLWILAFSIVIAGASLAWGHFQYKKFISSLSELGIEAKILKVGFHQSELRLKMLRPDHRLSVEGEFLARPTWGGWSAETVKPSSVNWNGKTFLVTGSARGTWSALQVDFDANVSSDELGTHELSGSVIDHDRLVLKSIRGQLDAPSHNVKLSYASQTQIYFPGLKDAAIGGTLRYQDQSVDFRVTQDRDSFVVDLMHPLAKTTITVPANFADSEVIVGSVKTTASFLPLSCSGPWRLSKNTILTAQPRCQMTINHQDQLARWIPQETAEISDLNLRLDASTKIFLDTSKLAKTRFNVDAKLAPDDLKINDIPLLGLQASAQVAYQSEKFKGNFSVSLQRFGKQAVLQNLSIKGRTNVAQMVTIDSFGFEAFGGSFGARPFDVDIVKRSTQGVLNASQIDLGLVLSALSPTTLKGKGKLEGSLPWSWSQEVGLVIADARLSNSGPGTIIYKDASVADVKKEISTLKDFNALLSRGSQALVFKALDYFEFHKLDVHLDRRPPDRLSASIVVKGRNPDLAKGQPFDLNLPVSGDLESLLMQSFFEATVEKSGWEKQINRWRQRGY